MSLLSFIRCCIFRDRREGVPRHLVAGEWGEKQADRHLSEKGYRILGRRVNVGRHDELDIIARSPDDVLVFIEVKTRGREDFGRPLAALDARKKRALSRAACAVFEKTSSAAELFPL